METLETIKVQFKNNFNLSVVEYNKNNYVLFFRNFRPSLEHLAKLLIFDFLNEEQLANDLLNGDVKLSEYKVKNLGSITKSVGNPSGAFHTCRSSQLVRMHLSGPVKW